MSAKRKLVIASVSIIIILVFVFAVREWSKIDSDDLIHSMIQTSDGGYAMIGTSHFKGATSAEDESLWLIKIDGVGNVQWNKLYSRMYMAGRFSLIQTNDDGFVLAGSAKASDSGSNNLMLIKTDPTGNAEWKKTLGEGQGFYSAVQTGDGGYVLLCTLDYGYGRTYFDLIRTDADGNVQWNRTYPGIARSMVQTSDGGYVLAGRGFTSNFWLVKTDVNGNMKWEKGYEMPNTVSAALGVIETDDDGYVTAGNLFFSIYDDPLIAQNDLGTWEQALWIIRTDALGNTMWNKTYLGAAPGDTGSVIQTSDGGYAATGGSYLVKTDAVGKEQWNRTYGEGVRIKSLLQTNDGGTVLAGSTSSNAGDFWLSKTDANGRVEWTKMYGRQRYAILALAATVEIEPAIHPYTIAVLETSLNIRDIAFLTL